MPIAGREPDTLGERSMPIGGGGTDFQQFRRHFSAQVISLRKRLLAGQEGRTTEKKIHSTEVDGTLAKQHPTFHA